MTADSSKTERYNAGEAEARRLSKLATIVIVSR
jgi:hypothetical protein